MPNNNKAPGHRINEIIKTSLALEMEDAREAGLVGYMARCLVQATMPHTDPKTSYFERTNGIVTLSIMGKPSIGLPYGSMPRTLLAWICTEAVRTKDPVLNLGRSQSEFLQRLGMHTDGRYTATLRNQAQRLFSSMISLAGEQGNDFGIENVVIAKRAFLFWNPKRPEDRALWDSTLTLTGDFFEEVTRSPVPIRIDYLHALRQSPLAMDIYTWLTYRVFLLRAKGRPFVQIPWVALQAQFGSSYGSRARNSPELDDKARERAERAALASFKYNFKKRLREVLIVYPEASDCIEDDGECLRIKSTRLHVTRAPGKGARIGPPPT